MQKMIVAAAPDFETISVPTANWRKKVHRLVTRQAFDIVIMACIILNMIQMALFYEGATDGYLGFLELVNYVFTAVFTLEAILKLIAFGGRYFKSTWNKFDFFVVVSSLMDIGLSFMSESNAKFLRVGPQLARVLRVLRVSRILRLIGKSKGLQALL